MSNAQSLCCRFVSLLLLMLPTACVDGDANVLKPAPTIQEFVAVSGVVWTVTTPDIAAPANGNLVLQLRNAPAAGDTFLLGTTPFTRTADDCVSTPCTWQASEVDILHATAGIFGSVVDAESGSDWALAFTPSVSSARVNQSKTDTSPIAGAIAYALPVQVQAKILAGTGVDAQKAVQQGTVIAIVSQDSVTQRMPTKGVAIASSSNAAQLFYFDDAFAHTSTAQTNGSGIFVVMGQSGNASTVNVPVTLTKSGAQWAPATLQIVPNTVTVVGLIAN